MVIAVCLFELKNMKNKDHIFAVAQKTIQIEIRLLLCIAYRDVYLGNKIQSLDYLKKRIKINGGDPTYQR